MHRACAVAHLTISGRWYWWQAVLPYRLIKDTRQNTDIAQDQQALVCNRGSNISVPSVWDIKHPFQPPTRLVNICFTTGWLKGGFNAPYAWHTMLPPMICSPYDYEYLYSAGVLETWTSLLPKEGLWWNREVFEGNGRRGYSTFPQLFGQWILGNAGINSEVFAS